MADTEIVVFRGRDGLTSLEKDWRRIAGISKNVEFYQYYQWYDSLLSTIFKDNHEIYFFVYYKNNAAAAIFPLMKTQKQIFGIKYDVLVLPDHPHIDLSDFIYSQEVNPSESLTALLKFLTKSSPFHWDMVFLPHLLENSPTIPALSELRCRLRRNVEKIGTSDYFSRQPYEELLKSFSKNFRNNLKKARKKLSRLENVSFTSCEKGSNLNQGFAKFIEVEASGWKGKNGTGTAIKLHPVLTEFYLHVARNFSHTGQCQINLLSVGKEYIAGQFCLMAKNGCSILKIGYHPAYAKLAPGNMLLEYTLKKNFLDEDICRTSLVTGTKWHADWHPSSCHVYKGIIYNRSLKGWSAFFLAGCRKFVKGIYYRWHK